MPVVRGVTPLSELPLPYPVYVGRDICSALGDVVRGYAPAHRVVVIADATVASLHGDALRSAFGGMRVDILSVPPGEAGKTRERWSQLTDDLLSLECGRDTTIVAVGGGVVGDLAGFVAATFMRGIPVVQVPTTLLSMVDASIGGKTGVDTPQGKNLVGAFHNPSAVLMDVSFLRTLPQAVFRSGFAEIIKHGVIADHTYLERVERLLPDVASLGPAAPDLPAVIAGSVRIKAIVVATDSREGGRRRILNFGHTIAHAIERATDYRVSHGDAVAVGMVVECRLAEMMKVAAAGLSARVADVLYRAGLPSDLQALAKATGGTALAPEALAILTRTDKKSASGSVRYALPIRIGAMHEADGQWALPVAEGMVVDALRRS